MNDGDEVPVEKDDRSRDVLRLCLYVAGKSPNSSRALANLHAIVRDCLNESEYQLEVVDVLAEPLRAVYDHVLLTPTLLKLTPPMLQIVGDLSQREVVLAALELPGQLRAGVDVSP